MKNLEKAISIIEKDIKENYFSWQEYSMLEAVNLCHNLELDLEDKTYLSAFIENNRVFLCANQYKSIYNLFDDKKTLLQSLDHVKNKARPVSLKLLESKDSYTIDVTRQLYLLLKEYGENDSIINIIIKLATKNNYELFGYFASFVVKNKR